MSARVGMMPTAEATGSDLRRAKAAPRLARTSISMDASTKRASVTTGNRLSSVQRNEVRSRVSAMRSQERHTKALGGHPSLGDSDQEVPGYWCCAANPLMGAPGREATRSTLGPEWAIVQKKGNQERKKHPVGSPSNVLGFPSLSRPTLRRRPIVPPKVVPAHSTGATPCPARPVGWAALTQRWEQVHQPRPFLFRDQRRDQSPKLVQLICFQPCQPHAR